MGLEILKASVFAFLLSVIQFTQGDYFLWVLFAFLMTLAIRLSQYVGLVVSLIFDFPEISGTPGSATIPIWVFFAISALLFTLYHHRDNLRSFFLEVLPFLIFSFTVVAMSFASTLSYGTENFENWLNFCLILASRMLLFVAGIAAYLHFKSIRTSSLIPALTATILITAVVSILGELSSLNPFSTASETLFWQYGRAYFPTDNPNILAGHLLISLVTLHLFLEVNRSKYAPVVFLVMGLLAFLIGSRSLILGVVVFSIVAVVLLINRGSQIGQNIFRILLLNLGWICPYLAEEFFPRGQDSLVTPNLIGLSSNPLSKPADNRLSIWEPAVEEAKRHFLLGIGFPDSTSDSLQDPHNSYLYFALHFGLLGSFILLLGIASFLARIKTLHLGQVILVALPVLTFFVFQDYWTLTSLWFFAGQAWMSRAKRN